MKIKIGSRIGEITPEYFAKFGKNYQKFSNAVIFMFPQATKAHIDDIWATMGGELQVQNPITAEDGLKAITNNIPSLGEVDSATLAASAQLKADAQKLAPKKKISVKKVSKVVKRG